MKEGSVVQKPAEIIGNWGSINANNYVSIWQDLIMYSIVRLSYKGTYISRDLELWNAFKACVEMFYAHGLSIKFDPFFLEIVKDGIVGVDEDIKYIQRIDEEIRQERAENRSTAQDRKSKQDFLKAVEAGEEERTRKDQDREEKLERALHEIRVLQGELDEFRKAFERGDTTETHERVYPDGFGGYHIVRNGKHLRAYSDGFGGFHILKP